MDHRFIRNRDIVLFSFQPWESTIAFNLQDMAYELARYNRVLFIDRALDRNTVLKNTLFNRRENKAMPNHREKVEKIQDDFWVLHPASLLESGNWAPTYALFDFFNRINNKRLAVEIKDVIRHLGFNDIIFLNDNDFFRGLYLKSLVPCREYIFYIRDYLTIQPFFKKFGPRCEKEMIEKADLVVANSAYLAEYTSQWNPNSTDIGQGCNLEAFIIDDQPMPADLVSLPRPLIGYCGAITSMRLDEAVLIHLADCFPSYSIVLVGPQDEYFQKSVLKEYRNVYFLGGKKPEETPSYIHHFDICINPQAVNLLTIGNYPRKVDEYLAAGKPVVATATHAMQMFRNYSFLCETKEDYVEQISVILQDQALFSEKERIRRRQFALQHTWENSIGMMGDAYFGTKKEYHQLAK